MVLHLSLFTIKALMEIMMGKNEVFHARIWGKIIHLVGGVLILKNLQVMNGSLWSYKSQGLLLRCRLPEGWIAVGNMGSIYGSRLGHHNHMIQVNHFAYQKSQNCKGWLGFRITLAQEICIPENMSRYIRLTCRAKMSLDWYYVRSKSSLSHWLQPPQALP